MNKFSTTLKISESTRNFINILRLDNKVGINFILFAIVAIGFILRLYNLGNRSLWLDEIYTVTLSKADLAYLLYQWNTQPSLYFVIVHFFMYLGTSEFVIRFPSVIFGVLAILLTYKVGKMLFGVKEGVISALLLSISVFAIKYSQEARMYSLFMFMALASLFFFYRAIQRNEKTMWIGFIVLTALSVYTHAYTLFAISAEILFLLFLFIERRIRSPKGTQLPEVGRKTVSMFFFSLAIIFIAIAPLLYSLLTWGQYEFWSWMERPTVSFLLSIFNEFSAGPVYLSTEFNSTLALCVFLFFLFIGILTSVRKFGEQTTLLLLWGIFPIAAAFAVSFLFLPILGHPRYLTFALPAYVIAISRGITFTTNRAIDFVSSKKVKSGGVPNLENGRLMTGLILAIIVFGSVSAPSLIGHFKDLGEDWRGAADYLKNNAQPGDVIVVEPNYTIYCLKYYYNADLTKTTITSSYGNVEKLQKICDESRRVWFVSSSHIQYTDRDGKIRDWVDKNFKAVEENFGSVYVCFREGQVKHSATT